MPACSVEPSSTRLSAISLPILYWTSSFAVHYRDGEKKTGKNVLGEVALDVAHSVEIADVDEGISGAARHARVDLSDNDIGALGRGTGGFDTSTHGAETVLICALRRCEQTDQGRKVQQANVHVVVAVAEKGGHFAEENGHLRISAAISQDT